MIVRSLMPRSAYPGLASPLRDASGRSIKQQTNNKQQTTNNKQTTWAPSRQRLKVVVGWVCPSIEPDKINREIDGRYKSIVRLMADTRMGALDLAQGVQKDRSQKSLLL